MTQYSYSRVSLFNDCPYHFRLRYIDKLTEIPDLARADNPLIIGHALHTGIENDVGTALNEYYNAFPVMNDAIVEESMKLEILIPKVQEFLSKNFEGCELIHEYKIDKPNYIGFVDLIVQAPDGTCMVIDFKYSNHIKNYMDSAQLHIYRDYLKQDGFNVEKLAYLFVPKTSIKKKQDEDLFHFRKRLVETVEESNLTFVPIEFDDMKTIYFLNNIDEIERTKDFSKRNKSKNCFACNPRFRPNYLEAIENAKGEIEMILPENKRRERKIDTKPDLWIYADSYTGKSTFVDKVENVLFLNTDGNTDNTTAPVVSIKDEVTKKGRVTSRKLAWDLFLDVIAELEAAENDFEAVSIDLVEDLYEHCRVYVFEKNGWEHESDGTYGKGWSMVTTEFNNAMKRLKALGYQIIYISKEKVEEYTLKGGAKRTTFKPNINDKVANFLSGTVDLTLRAYVDADDKRFLQLAKKQNVFGGGRYDFQVETIPLEMEAFIEELTAAQEGNEGKVEKPKRDRKKKDDESQEDGVPSESDSDAENTEEKSSSSKRKRTRQSVETNDETETNSKEESPVEEEKPKRERKPRKTVEEPAAEEKPKRQRRQRKPVEDDTPPGEGDGNAPAEEEAPKRRTRRKRGE